MSEEKFLIIQSSKPEDWYHELDNKIIPYLKKDDSFFYVDIRGEAMRISIDDAHEAEEVELDLPEDVIESLEKHAKEMGITVDELVNLCLVNYIKGKQNEEANNK